MKFHLPVNPKNKSIVEKVSHNRRKNRKNTSDKKKTKRKITFYLNFNSLPVLHHNADFL